MFSDKSIAVLPFANRSDRKEDEYFTDGMHDELLTRLSRIAAMKVISRTSVMRYRDTDKSIPEIARELSVANLWPGAEERISKMRSPSFSGPLRLTRSLRRPGWALGTAATCCMR